MKMIDKVKAGLKCCTSIIPPKPGDCIFAPSCDECNGAIGLKTCAFLLILQNEKDIAAMSREIQGLKIQKDALLADLKEADKIECEHCKHYKHAENNECDTADFDCGACENNTCGCKNCRDNSNWLWRGVQEDK